MLIVDTVNEQTNILQIELNLLNIPTARREANQSGAKELNSRLYTERKSSKSRQGGGFEPDFKSSALSHATSLNNYDY